MTGKHSSIVLFIRGLPESVTRRELRTFFQGVLHSGWASRLSGHGSVGSCDIVRITDRDSGTIEFHGLVEIQPARVAIGIVKGMEGSRLHGQPVEIRRYHQRSALRDRRKEDVAIAEDDRRRQGMERRREGLNIELVSWHGTDLIPSMMKLFQPHRTVRGFEA